MRNDRLALVLGAAIVTSVVGVSAASAQYGPPPPPPQQGGYYPPPYYPPPPPPGIERHGLALGGTIGGGSVSFQDPDAPPGVDTESYGGPTLSFHIGASISQQAQILLDLWGTFFSPVDDQDVAHNVITIGVRYFPIPKLWVQAGLGFSYFQITDHRNETVGESEDGAAAMGAVGIDLFQGWSYSIDLSLRLAISGYDENPDATTGGLQLGFNWY